MPILGTKRECSIQYHPEVGIRNRVKNSGTRSRGLKIFRDTVPVPCRPLVLLPPVFKVPKNLNSVWQSVLEAYDVGASVRRFSFRWLVANLAQFRIFWVRPKKALITKHTNFCPFSNTNKQRTIPRFDTDF